jgi:hypothetical protein
MSPNWVLQILFVAVFGLVLLAVASDAVRDGVVTLRGVHVAREARPAAFWVVTTTYLVAGLLSLAGAAGIWFLSLSER